MPSTFGSLDVRLRRLPDPALLAIGLAMVAGIAATKMTLGHDVPIVDFFLIAVVGVGWFARARWYGYAVAAVAAMLSVAMSTVGQSDAFVSAAVAAGAARLVLYVIVLTLLGAMRRERAAHQAEARTDQQTGAANSRAFRTLALAEIERSRRYQRPLSLAYVDVDDFKAVNDRLGHVEGDHILSQVSHVLRSVVRSVDTVARLGGDEFVVLMPETGRSDARALVDRVREELASLSTKDGRSVPCSIGLVTFARPPVSLQELVNAADDLMYRAKDKGKDRIEQAERSDAYVLTSSGERASGGALPALRDLLLTEFRRDPRP
jgi:diguanylate cyclase (GGDEF)-like protein